jgi:hypothetical protein
MTWLVASEVCMDDASSYQFISNAFHGVLGSLFAYPILAALSNHILGGNSHAGTQRPLEL